MPVTRMTPVFLAVLLGITLLAGCSTGDGTKEKPAGGQPVNKGPEQPADNDHPNETITMQIYFARDNQGKLELVPVTREAVPAGEGSAGVVRKALELLQTGPTEDEKEKGLHNNLPDAELLDLHVQRPHVALDFSREFEQVGGTYRVTAMVDQLAYTMSAIPGIKSVDLLVEGQRVGTGERPFTGEGLLFGYLTIDPAGETAASLGPADTLDLFIAAIPDVDKMWSLMGPQAREIYKEPGGIEYTAFHEGLGNWKDYQVTEEKIENDIAVVTINGDQVLEGVEQPDATYTAYLVREEGRWKWDFPPTN